MTLTDEQQLTIVALNEIFRSMDADESQKISRAYRKTMEGLYELAELLKVANAKQEQPTGPLLPEHLYAIEALDTMKQSLLSAVL
jgi:hypothetical protein